MHFASNSGPSECGQLVKRYVPKLGAFGRGGGSLCYAGSGMVLLVPYDAARESLICTYRLEVSSFKFSPGQHIVSLA